MPFDRLHSICGSWNPTYDNLEIMPSWAQGVSLTFLSVCIISNCSGASEGVGKAVSCQSISPTPPQYSVHLWVWFMPHFGITGPQNVKINWLLSGDPGMQKLFSGADVLFCMFWTEKRTGTSQGELLCQVPGVLGIYNGFLKVATAIAGAIILSKVTTLNK